MEYPGRKGPGLQHRDEAITMIRYDITVKQQQTQSTLCDHTHKRSAPGRYSCADIQDYHTPTLNNVQQSMEKPGTQVQLIKTSILYCRSREKSVLVL